MFQNDDVEVRAYLAPRDGRAAALDSKILGVRGQVCTFDGATLEVGSLNQVENMRWIKSGDVSPRSTQGEFARVSCFQ